MQDNQNQISSGKLVLVRSVFVFIAALFIFFPLFNDLFKVVREPAPRGIPKAPPPAPFSVKLLKKRVWQKKLEIRAKKESGLWTPLLKTGNDIYRMLYGQIGAFHGGSILFGRGEHLLQSAHIISFNRKFASPPGRIRNRLQLFKRIQDEMRLRGKAIVLLLAPNSTELYPELLPEEFKDPTRLNRENTYLRAKKILDELGIIYLDAFELLNEAKGQYPFRFMARSGSHWNDVASCISLQTLNNTLKSNGLPRFREFSCDNWHIEDLPRGKDRDLLDIANLMWPERLMDPSPYVDIRYLEDEITPSPKVLLVGTSYLFAIMEHLEDWKLSNDARLFFYYRQWRRLGERVLHPIRKDTLDWKDLINRDITIIAAGISTPTSLGYGYLEDLARQLGIEEVKEKRAPTLKRKKKRKSGKNKP